MSVLRILALVPLLAAGVDLTRAQVLCGSNAQTCLEAAGRGWLGTFGIVLVLLTALAGGLAVVRRRARSAEPFARTWLFATLALMAVVNGQDAVAQLLGAGSLALAPAGTLALCAAAGAVLALALRGLDRVAELVANAPRALPRPVARLLGIKPPPQPVYITVDGTRRGRAPPSR